MYNVLLIKNNVTYTKRAYIGYLYYIYIIAGL